MSAGRTPRVIDVERLPEDVVALVEALRPGENLVITRDGEAVATVTSALGVVVTPAPPDESAEAAGPSPTGAGNMTVVVTAMKLSESARVSLSDQLGPGYIVLDMHAAPATADVLLVPPVSPQLIGSLRSAFPGARVVVTEIEDDELGVSYHGPVRRMLDAGAEAYLPANSIPRLARQLEHTLVRRGELVRGETTAPEIGPAPRDHTPEEE